MDYEKNPGEGAEEEKPVTDVNDEEAGKDE